MIRCLGRFIPSRLDGYTIAVELRSWLMSIGIEPREAQIGVRSPADTAAACESTPVLMKWHRDGAGPEPTRMDVDPSIRKLIVWSNKTPTRLRRNGEESLSEPFDVILFNNIYVWHASPPPEDGRWFVNIADPIVSAYEQ